MINDSAKSEHILGTIDELRAEIYDLYRYPNIYVHSKAVQVESLISALEHDVINGHSTCKP